MRSTETTILVLKTILNATRPISGADISRETGIQSGSLYPILHRLERDRHVVAAEEDIDPRIAGRPRRTFYKLAPSSRAEITSMVAKSRWSQDTEAPYGLA